MFDLKLVSIVGKSILRSFHKKIVFAQITPINQVTIITIIKEFF